MTKKTMEKRFEKLAKSIVILEAKDEWWNGSEKDATLADMDWKQNILAFIKAELQANNKAWKKRIEKALSELVYPDRKLWVKIKKHLLKGGV